MPKIYDNIENHLTKGLNDTLELSHRTDFCVGYFNLRGWKEIGHKIDNLCGGTVSEGKEDIHRCCRLLVGMQKLPIDIIREHFSHDESHVIDQTEVVKLKKKLAQEFKEQLTIGNPSEEDERALRKLSQQMKDKKVVVKLHLRYPLHAKLYLAFSDDKRVPVVGFLGSSNLTLAGLAKQGELNVDVMDQDASNKLAKWFNDRWQDRWCIDITQELIEIIDNQNLYWALLISVPLLAIAVYYAKRKKYVMLPDNTIDDIRFGSGYVKFKPTIRSMYESKIDTSDLTVLIGNRQCAQPYNSSILNLAYCIENRSNGITQNRIKLFNMVAFTQDLIENETDCAELNKQDVVLQISTDHAGRTSENESFDFKLLSEKVSNSKVKMIVLKLLQDANLTSKKNAQGLPEIKAGCNEKVFFNAEGMILFLEKLRQLSGKKPVGISIRICNKKRFYEICYAIRKIQIIPDFIIVEGYRNNVKNWKIEFRDHADMHLYDALLFVTKIIESYGLNKEIKIIASGNVRSGFEVLKLLALGANAICVQHIPFQIKELERDKRIQSYFLTHTLYELHCKLIKDTIAIMKTCGYKKMNEITLSSFFRCMSIFESERSEEINNINAKIISIEKRDRNLKVQETSSEMPGKAEPSHKQIAM